ncbi:unnamed protein product, partial [Larinioides sclopetarius]
VKTSTDNDGENSDEATHEETKETSECLAVQAEDMLEHPTIGASTNRTADNEIMNSDNTYKLNLVQDSSSFERTGDQPHEGSNSTEPEESKLLSSEMVDVINDKENSFQTLSEVINANQKTSIAPQKEKLSLLKRIFRRKKK